MFKMVYRLLSLLVVLSGWALAALSLHIVRTPGHLELIPKDHLDYHDTWCDTRTWTLNDVANHPIMVNRLIAANRTELLKHVADPKSHEDLKLQLADALRQGPQSQETPAKPGTQVTAGPFSVTLPF